MFNWYAGYKEEFEFISETETRELENKDQNESLVLLERIDKIVKIHSFMINHCENEEKKVNCQKTLDEHLAICSDILGISALQTLLFIYILNSGSLSLGGLAKSLKVTMVQCFEHLDDLDVLLDKRLIMKSGRGEEEIDSNYCIPYKVIQSLREGKAFTPPRYHDLSKDEFFEHLKKLFSGIFSGKISKEIFLMDFFNLFEDNPQLEFVKRINSLFLTEENMLFLSCICTRFYVEGQNTFRTFDVNFYKCLGNKKDFDLQQLFELELVECSGDNLEDKGYIVLTQKVIIELLGITEVLHKSKSESDIINHENIVQKELFYNAKEGKLVEQLADLLLEKNYKNITERLKSRGMKTGFSCLFFGAPGTGKTETVYQIACMSGRDIMPINISMVKCHRFGESEKIIKNIFS